MSGVREVIETFQVPLDPTKDFRLELPTRFLHDEPHRERVIQVWNKDVVATINSLCRARKSGFINRSLKRSVFQSGMENVCKDFSRKTDNIIVQFQQSEETDQHHHHRKTVTYSLVLTRLSAVTQHVRSARACVAEIPVNPLTQPAVQAELVTTTAFGEQGTTSSSTAVPTTTDGDAPTMRQPEAIPFAHSEIISTHVPIIEYMDDDDNQPYVNPPVASQVTALVQDQDEEMSTIDEHHPRIVSDRDSRRSPLERMQELESIKGFLTEAEYTAKRQAILESI